MTAPQGFAASTVVRGDPPICPKCVQPIKPGQVFRLGEPRRHAFCDPPTRLDVQRVAAAARTR